MAHAQTIVVYGLGRIMQKLGYADAVGDAHADEGIDAELGRKTVGGRRNDGAFGLEQAVETLHKVGMRGEESLVEMHEEVLQIALSIGLRLKFVAYLVYLARRDEIEHRLLENLHIGYIFRHELVNAYEIAVVIGYLVAQQAVGTLLFRCGGVMVITLNI